MDTNAESSMQNEVIEYVKQYAMITLSISIMSVGVYFFKFPNNFVFGGVTGMAALAAKLTPLSASAFSSAANMILLGVGLIFLGKKFAMTTGYATVVMSLELMALEKLCPLRGPLSDQPMLDLLFAIALPAIASALLFNVGASSGGTDVIALIVEKYTHIHNVAVALFLTDLFMVIAACFVFDLYTAPLVSSMVAGRLVWGAVRFVLAGLSGSSFPFSAFLSGAVLTAVPGIVAQLILIPLIVAALQKAKLTD